MDACAHELPVSARLKATILTPIVAPIADNRAISLILAAIGSVQVGLLAAGQHGWQCPIKAALGIPCPGCGLTTATLLLLRGKWRESLATHAFAPLFLIGLVLVTVAGLLPGKWHTKAVNLIAAVERHTGLAALVLLALVGYWGMRLLSIL